MKRYRIYVPFADCETSDDRTFTTIIAMHSKKYALRSDYVVVCRCTVLVWVLNVNNLAENPGMLSSSSIELVWSSSSLDSDLQSAGHHTDTTGLFVKLPSLPCHLPYICWMAIAIYYDQCTDNKYERQTLVQAQAAILS